MPVDLTHERLVFLRHVRTCQDLPRQARVALRTLEKWRDQGLPIRRGAYAGWRQPLECLPIGIAWATSIEALDRFFRRISGELTPDHRAMKPKEQ